MSPQARIVAILLACLACVGVGCRLGVRIKQGEWDASTVADQKARDETAQIIAQRLADMASTQAKTVERVTHEVKTNTVYASCTLPDSGIRLLNDAISGTTQPASDNGVQAPATAP
jgi:hypothetical protein